MSCPNLVVDISNAIQYIGKNVSYINCIKREFDEDENKLSFG